MFSCEENIEQVILYGSRAKGNYKPFSDVDIVLSGDKLEFMDLYRVILTIDDLLLPYLFDISLYKDLDSPDLIEHIRRVGIVIYDRRKVRAALAALPVLLSSPYSCGVHHRTAIISLS